MVRVNRAAHRTAATVRSLVLESRLSFSAWRTRAAVATPQTCCPNGGDPTQRLWNNTSVRHQIASQTSAVSPRPYYLLLKVGRAPELASSHGRHHLADQSHTSTKRSAGAR